MKTNKNIQQQIENTFDAMDSIQQVNVSPFFKDKTLQRMFSKKEETVSIWSWFTPQLQLATLVCVLAINVYAIRQIKNSSYNESISTFATDYGLSAESKSSTFNL
ncbi:hypothetical protein [Olleya sp. R77988]|uniref:hypothetical protein n=1 Tax=Olleya sp. R77988 TaxID=3093875 RepID=UPI0037CB7C7C